MKNALEPKLFVVEDDPTIRALLEMALLGAGYTDVSVFDEGRGAFAAIAAARPDLVLLDLMLPGLDGMSIARAIREHAELSDTRILMITARTAPEDIVAGLEAGADDYVTKPYDRRVLLARVKAVLRRAQPAVEGVDFDGLTLDETSQSAALNGAPIALTAGEFALLKRLAAHRGRILPRGADGRSLDVQIAKLRQKLGAWGDHIETVRGIGYRVT